METTQKAQVTVTNTRRHIYQQVTDTIIKQLEAGTVPWHKPWKSDSNPFFGIPQNATTGTNYRGINILLLWASAIERNFPTQDWASLKQWNTKKEVIRKGEKGSMIVYYDTIEREIEGELQKIPFLKSSVVFNRSQLANYQPPEKNEHLNEKSLVEKIAIVDSFVTNTGATIEYKDNKACYIPSQDKINMPLPEAFMNTDACTATEGFYATLLHELTHWSGSKGRLNREGGKRFGDENYATEELVAELGAAFMCSEFDITNSNRPDQYASYIANWLKVLKDNKHCVITAASEASKAVAYLKELQPKE